MQHVKFNKPQHGHGVNGANTSMFKPVAARSQLNRKDDKRRAEAFHNEQAELRRLTREAQAAARGNSR